MNINDYFSKTKNSGLKILLEYEISHTIFLSLDDNSDWYNVFILIDYHIIKHGAC
jgi:hypothetical protein